MLATYLDDVERLSIHKFVPLQIAADTIPRLGPRFQRLAREQLVEIVFEQRLQNP